MKIIDLLNDIENDEIEDGTIFEVIGDFFYKLIVIDKNLYCINEMTKKLELLDSKYIGRFDNRQYEIVKLSNKVEKEKKILILEKLELPSFIEFKTMTPEARYVVTAKEYDVLNDIIDYLKSKGE